MGYETPVLGHSREAFLAIERVAILFLAAGIVVASVLADRTGAGRMLAWGFAGTIVVGFLLGPMLGAASLFVVLLWLALAPFLIGFPYGPPGGWLPSGRKCVVVGKSGLLRVAFGGRRHITKKN